MLIGSKNIRVSEWFDADDHTTVYVVEVNRNGSWSGVMINGRPQVFQTKSEAEELMNVIARTNIPKKNITDALVHVGRHDGGKGIIPKHMKHIPLN